MIGSFVEYKGGTGKDAFDLTACKISRNVKGVLAMSIMKEKRGKRRGRRR
ncbi:MAG TPA: hypothetical protein VNI77_06150 [Nitrososphaera sp.]|nr:hypothetical protein [Nitrososphaera sp.]